MIPGIVLAAGKSSRMGQTKALMGIGEADTFLTRVVQTLRAGGVEDIVVVVGADAAAITSFVHRASMPVRLVHNAGWEKGQLSSLLAGLNAIDHPGVTAALVTLIDVPLVTPETVRTLVAEFKSGSALIVRPASRGRHGHPVIFDRGLFDEFRRADPKEGAKQVVRAHTSELLDVEVADEGAFADIDTPEEYARYIWLAMKGLKAQGPSGGCKECAEKVSVRVEAPR